MKNIQTLTLNILLALSFGCFAQSSIPSNAKQILISKEWIMDGLESDEHKIVFTNTKMTVYSNGDLIGEDEYYFVNEVSECGPNKFKESNVGVLNTGKYLVFKNYCLELINISNYKLEFKNLVTNSITSATPK